MRETEEKEGRKEQRGKSRQTERKEMVTGKGTVGTKKAEERKRNEKRETKNKEKRERREKERREGRKDET